MNHPINYHLISDAIKFYRAVGYKYIEVPWIVNKNSVELTLPKNKKPFLINSKALVGSAEQSFVEMMANGTIQPGCYVAASPCFRDDEEDDLHQKTFFKVELIHILGETTIYEQDIKDNISSMVIDCFKFFRSISGRNADGVKFFHTKEGMDMELNGIEIGSYGYRSHGDHNWIYGTGLAEPRFSIANNIK